MTPTTIDIAIITTTITTSTQTTLGMTEISVDQFAQTRQPDDLFDDDFTPIAEPVSQFLPPEAPRGPSNTSTSRGGRGRGRGSHGPRAADTGRASKPSGPPASKTEILISTPNTSEVSTKAPLSSTEASESISSTTIDPSAPPDEGAATLPKPTSFAVRGPRLATGGLQKPKLTESELSAKMAAAAVNNARREEAHRLAEADEASFRRREEIASEKRREEGMARKVMDGERERNRVRKLGARGREWDEGKAEEEEVRGAGGTRGARRGGRGFEGRGALGSSGQGGVEGQGGSERRGGSHGTRGSEGRRGQGGRESTRAALDGRARSSRGRGRGNILDKKGDEAAKAKVLRGEDFPTLPVKFPDTKDQAKVVNDSQKTSASLAVLEIKEKPNDRTSWADQMEPGTPRTPLAGESGTPKGVPKAT